MVVWFGIDVQLQINRLLKLQIRAARIFRNVNLVTISEQMFFELKWLLFPQRLRYHACVMMYKALNNMVPEYIQNLFQKTSDTNNKNLQSADDKLLRTPFSQTNYYANIFTIKGAQEWNSLPLELRPVATLQRFKSSVKTFLNNS